MYVYIKDEQVFLMMKVIGGKSIATDNTCKTYKELKNFFDNAPGELDNVIRLYELLGEDDREKENIANVLAQLKDYRDLLTRVNIKQSTAAMAADDYQVVIPKGLYEMVLDSRTNPDNFLKSTKPIFAVAHRRIGDGAEDKDSILGGELRAGFTAINAADIKTTGPTVEGYKKHVAALVEGKKLVLPMTENKDATLSKLEKVWQDLGYPQASWDETAKGTIEQRMEYMKTHAPDDDYDAGHLVEVLDKIAEVIFLGEASNNFKTFAANICGKNDYDDDTKTDTRTDKLSVLTQFFLASANIYLHEKYEYKTNLGEFFDKHESFSEQLAATVSDALLSDGDVDVDVEDVIIKFLETNNLISAVADEDITAIKKEFSTNYLIVRDFDYMDEFFVKPKNKDSSWFEYGGSMCVEFSEFAKGVNPDESSEFINGKIAEFKSVSREDDNSITYAGDASLELINKLEGTGYPAHKLLDIMLENNITDPELFGKVISKIDRNKIDAGKLWCFVVKNNQMQLLEFLTTNNIACPIDAKIDGL
ncbi:MAG: hypothetical protein HON78_00570, partial [Legionellales bacterium]|nr:hypothetical protein [Legionellales bacterium]